MKKSLAYIKCVLHLSCVVHEPIYGPFMGCTVNGFLYLYKVYQGWELHQNGPTDLPKENGPKFAPTAPVASKFLLRNTRQSCFPFVIFLQTPICIESESTVANLCKPSRLKPVTEPWLLRVTQTGRDEDSLSYSRQGWVGGKTVLHVEISVEQPTSNGISGPVYLFINNFRGEENFHKKIIHLQTDPAR